jgi:ketosteroid isomerase-like protein
MARIGSSDPMTQSKKESSVNDSVRKELQSLDKEWSSAIVKNDAEAIGRFMADDWIIIGPEGNVIDRARFLGVIKSGDLVHESMESDDWRVRVYADTAVVTAQARSRGKYKGQAFATHERSTSVFVLKDGRWQCVLTQLTPIIKK